jgi:hypothetical protein
MAAVGQSADSIICERNQVMGVEGHNSVREFLPRSNLEQDTHNLTTKPTQVYLRDQEWPPKSL